MLLNLNVLSLNRSYQPLGIINLKNAVKSVVNGRAEIVKVDSKGHYYSYNIHSWAELSSLKRMLEEEDGTEDWLINNEDYAIEAPRIIRFLNHDRVHFRGIKFNRKNLFIRDNYTCQYCGKTGKDITLQLEHVIPKSRGGKAMWTNTVCACHNCNSKKGSKTPEEAGMKLIRKPFVPKYIPLGKAKLEKEKYYSWKNFISDLYWNIEIED